VSQLTPHDDVKKQVSEILKRVDHLIKAGNVDLAVREVISAKEIDPSNAYICAYEERLEFLRLEHEKHSAQEQSRKEAEEMARERDQMQRNQMEEEHRRLLQEQKRLEDKPKQSISRSNVDAEQTRKDQSVQLKSPVNNASEKSSVKMPTSERISPDSIPPSQQLTMKPQSHPVSNDFRQDQKRVEGSTVLVIDDDEEMLKAIDQILSFHGLNVTVLTTTDEAMALLRKWTPELILCDVNLETSTMGGFSFYESIRRLEHLNQVPFIFLTGLNDRILIRTGKEMGVDEYLTKPITEENLVAAVKGKLKRFGLLNRTRSAGQTT